MKKNIAEIFSKTNHKISKLKLIRNGETSYTYFGYFNNKKSIFKILKKSINKNLENKFYFEKISRQIVKENLLPKIIYSDNKNSLYVYEYFDGKELKTLNKELIIKTGSKLKKLHSLDLDKNLKSFDSQINLYIKEIKKNKNNKILKEGIKHFTKLRDKNFDNVVSHNDLNNSNILFNNYEVRFIDYDYLSINDRFCDLARICSSYKFSKTDIEVFLESYGLDCSKNNLDILKSWQLMNSYTDVIWFYFIKESDLNFFSQNQMVAKAKKLIKQQKQ
jgi:thiamine kinase-like enzyme|tara:strand:+ start:2333 stop:3160 length:828 start_codon:yes stop_codon:yes gene_type:complete